MCTAELENNYGVNYVSDQREKKLSVGTRYLLMVRYNEFV